MLQNISKTSSKWIYYDIMDPIKQGNDNVICCTVIQSLPGVMLVSYVDDDGKTYQGALLDISKR